MVKVLSKRETFATLTLALVTRRRRRKMRENIIERVLALTDEQIQDLLTLIQQSEEAGPVSEVPRQASA